MKLLILISTEIPDEPGRPGAPAGEVMVQMRTLDKALEQGRFPLPSILKIDVEGAEIICLKGAIKLLQGKLGRKPWNDREALRQQRQRGD